MDSKLKFKKKDIFANSLLDATIQDNDIRERSDVSYVPPYHLKKQKQKQKKKKINIKSRKVNKKKIKIFKYKCTIIVVCLL